VVNDACSHSDIFSVIIYIPQRYVSKYIFLIYSRIKWPTPPSPRDIAWEAELAVIIKLSVAYEDQKKYLTDVTTQLDDLRDTHFREATLEDNLYLEFAEKKAAFKAFQFE